MTTDRSCFVVRVHREHLPGAVAADEDNRHGPSLPDNVKTSATASWHLVADPRALRRPARDGELAAIR